MLKQVILVALALASVAQIIPLAADLPPGTVNLVADNGQFLFVCEGCGGAKPDSAGLIQASGKDKQFIWNLEVVGTKVAFRDFKNLYLSRCGSCWTNAIYVSSAFVHGTSPGLYTLFTPELQPNGKYAFKGDNGKYLARCEACVPNGYLLSFAFIMEGNASKPRSQWTVTYTNLPQLGLTSIRADNGDYLKLCNECGASNSVSVQSGYLTAYYQTVYQWNIVRVGNKIALQASSGLWLSVCNNCWSPALSADSAFAHLSTNTSPFSQWTATLQPSGKWTLQGSNGKYLARCTNCAGPSNVPNLAFVHATSASDPLAQWTLSKV